MRESMLKKILVCLICFLVLLPLSFAIEIPDVGPSGPITGVGITGQSDVEPIVSCIQGCIAR